MISIRRPRIERIENLLEAAGESPLTYPHEGMVRDAKPDDRAPAGYRYDYAATLLGEGQEVFERASQALREWCMFPPAMAELYHRDTPIEVGRVVAVLFGGYGIWTLNPARILYTIDEQGERPRFGFGYGTLSGHLARGEERFMVEWDRETDEVVFSISAMSRPHHFLSWIGYPMLRREQRRFRRLAGEAMRDAVAEDQVTAAPEDPGDGK
jgi:uncharacterized protein (UPF0548 family)